MSAPEPAQRGREREEESEDESEILEESPCGRWQKRREQVNQGNMPGIQSTFLAMDTEEGVEVVWNELHFTDRKAFKAHEEKIQTMFEQLVVVDHPNIVKLHKYWLDTPESKARVIFITEYVSSGSLKQFLKKTKKNHKAMNARAWKRWCTQILSALSFLHSCDPPIIHGNLTSDTIFIQHNGLIKIGSVWHRVFSNAIPDDLRSPIRIEREEQRNLHFFPPEYGHVADGTAVDIFSFGMCALEMAVLEIQANGDTRVTEEAIARAGHSLDDDNMREFILSCLLLNPARRPSAHNLLFHRVLFEVHSLKLLAAHCFIQHQYLMPENVVEEKTKMIDLNMVMAEIRRTGRPGVQWRNGIYPLMNFAASRPLGLPRALTQPPEDAQKAKTPTPEPFDVETRKVRGPERTRVGRGSRPLSGLELVANEQSLPPTAEGHLPSPASNLTMGPPPLMDPPRLLRACWTADGQRSLQWQGGGPLVPHPALIPLKQNGTGKKSEGRWGGGGSVG
uniref:Nuclear receptor-binding protein 2 n=1 Tax=Ornithorhynchus anatinus TaxID=9258 RepID=A0A6I8NB56_ORNAN